MRVNNQDNKTMRIDVQKSHHHNHRHRHHHSKHKRRHKDTVGVDDVSPVISVPSDTTASEIYFPLAKVQSDNSCNQSPENRALRKRRHRCSDGGFEERTGLNSECGEDEHAKRRRKHKHKEKKKRKHNNKLESDADHDRCRSLQQREKRDWGTQSGEDSPVRQQEAPKLIKVKQEPMSSDEEATRRHGNVEHREKNTSDRNGHSVSRTTRSLKPDRPIKIEHRDHSCSHERNLQSDYRYDTVESKNANSDSNYEYRHRRNGRVNGETSSVSDERAHRSRTTERGRGRRQRSDEQESHSRKHRKDSKPDIRRIKKQRPSDDEAEYEWGKPSNKRPQATNSGTAANSAAADQKKPNFGLSGKLTEDVNVYNGVVIKYSEPPEARKPKRRWRFYPFKGDEALPTLYIHRQSAYLIGRDRKVADIPVDHPSCSKQHAALQYRLVPFTREDGTKGKRVRPYIIDLESSNGTYVNNKRIEPRKYVELMERDVIKFGYSSRDYVLLHEHSKGDEEDDDQNG